MDRKELMAIRDKAIEIVKIFSKVNRISNCEIYPMLSFEDKSIKIDWETCDQDNISHHHISIYYEALDWNEDQIFAYFSDKKAKEDEDERLQKRKEKLELQREKRLDDYKTYLQLKKVFDGLTDQQVQNHSLWREDGSYIND